MSDGRPQTNVRATIFVAIIDPEGEEDYDWVQAWFARWGERVRIEKDSSSDPDFLLDVEGPAEAIAEIPARMRCGSEWSSAQPQERVAMSGQLDGPQISTWFWELLESSHSSLRTLCRKLEQLQRERLRDYRRQYDEAKEYVNPCYSEVFDPYLTRGCSEDHGDDFSAWVVMRGHRFYEQVRTDPASIMRYLDLFDDVECNVEGAPRWDERVDREEYRGYQRADYIATPIYRMRFGQDLDEEPV